MIPHPQTLSFAIWSAAARDEERQCIVVMLALAGDALSESQIAAAVGHEAKRGIPLHIRLSMLVDEKLVAVSSPTEGHTGPLYYLTAKGFSRLRHILPTAA